MTREEAIDIIKCLAWHRRPNEEDIEQAIEALSAEPCEDAVSRAELEKCFTVDMTNLSIAECLALIIKRAKALPSIQPKPKTGHWIDSQCDCCGKVASFHIGRCGGNAYTEMYYSNYCPNCGAKMVESEDKE